MSSSTNTAPLSVTLAEAIGAEKLAEVQEAVSPTTRPEPLLKELVLGSAAMVRMAGRSALRRVRAAFARARAS